MKVAIAFSPAVDNQSRCSRDHSPMQSTRGHLWCALHGPVGREPSAARVNALTRGIAWDAARIVRQTILHGDMLHRIYRRAWDLQQVRQSLASARRTPGIPFPQEVAA